MASRFENGESITCEANNQVLDHYREEPQRASVNLAVLCEFYFFTLPTPAHWDNLKKDRSSKLQKGKKMFSFPWVFTNFMNWYFREKTRILTLISLNKSLKKNCNFNFLFGVINDIFLGQSALFCITLCKGLSSSLWWLMTFCSLRFTEKVFVLAQCIQTYFKIALQFLFFYDFTRLLPKFWYNSAFIFSKVSLNHRCA